MGEWGSFKTRVPGKWVLCGEHAVLRGATAVALPHPERALTLEFEPGGRQLVIEPEASRSAVSGMLEGLLARGTRPQGMLRLSTTIPVGAGLGSSAALCVAVTRWVRGPLEIPDEGARIFELARSLENRFHGKSSGMDIAACLYGEPIAFSMKQGARPLRIHAPLPRFTFHDTGLRARTRDCVAKVEQLREARWDQLMGEASSQAGKGLEKGDRHAIADAMNQANSCFEAWGLVPREVAAQRELLLAQGALGAKLTGAGGGGFLVALWP